MLFITFQASFIKDERCKVIGSLLQNSIAFLNLKMAGRSLRPASPRLADEFPSGSELQHVVHARRPRVDSIHTLAHRAFVRHRARTIV